MPYLANLWDYLDQMHKDGSNEVVGHADEQGGGCDVITSVEMPKVWTPNSHITDLKAVGQTAGKWKRRYSEENGKEYFENMATGDTSWDLPAGAALEEEVLPPGWERRYSTEDKKHYYANEALDKSVWDVSEIGEGSG